MIEILVVLLLAAHFVCVNVASTGPLFCIWLAWRSCRGDEDAIAVGQRLAHRAWQLLVAGSAIGLLIVGLGSLSGENPFLRGLARVPQSRVYWGVGELFVSLACMIPCGIFWQRLRRRPIVLSLIAVFAATNLMYHFPPLFAVVSRLAAEPPGDALDYAVFLHLMLDREVVAHWLHHTLAAVGVTGAYVLWLWLRIRRGHVPPEPQGDETNASPARVPSGAAWIALTAVVLQLPVGAWLAASLPAGARNAVLGGELLATGLLLVSIVAVVILLQSLLAIALGETEKRGMYRVVFLTVVIVVLMTGTLKRTHGPARVSAGESRGPDASTIHIKELHGNDYDL